MNLIQILDDIENCTTPAALVELLHNAARHKGFQAFGFLDTTHAENNRPEWCGTAEHDFVETYRQEEFFTCDPILSRSLRTNLPFKWSDIQTAKKSPAAKVMSAAFDFGFRDGFVVPFHYHDRLGRRYSSACTFFWKNRVEEFKAFFRRSGRHDMHVILLYWAQKYVDLRAAARRQQGRFLNNHEAHIQLTARERDVLSWAGRGKTVSETADILSISYDTVETHIRNAMHKLNTFSKTHAVAKAIYLSLIDI